MKHTYLLVSLGFLVAGCGAQRSSPEAAPHEDRSTAAGQAAPPAAAPEQATSAAPGPGASSEKDEAPAEEKRKSLSGHEPSSLAVEVEAFDDALAPEQLSCQRARPHRDAICAIAERMCELPPERPSTTQPGPRCQEARQSCETAKGKFKARCG